MFLVKLVKNNFGLPKLRYFMGRCHRCGHHKKHCRCHHHHKHHHSSGSSSFGTSSSFKLVKHDGVYVLPQCRFGVKHDKHHHNSSSSTLSSSVSSTASKNEQILVGRKKCGKIVRLRRRVNELAC